MFAPKLKDVRLAVVVTADSTREKLSRTLEALEDSLRGSPSPVLVYVSDVTSSGELHERYMRAYAPRKNQSVLWAGSWSPGSGRVGGWCAGVSALAGAKSLAPRLEMVCMMSTDVIPMPTFRDFLVDAAMQLRTFSEFACVSPYLRYINYGGPAPDCVEEMLLFDLLRGRPRVKSSICGSFVVGPPLNEMVVARVDDVVNVLSAKYGDRLAMTAFVDDCGGSAVISQHDAADIDPTVRAEDARSGREDGLGMARYLLDYYPAWLAHTARLVSSASHLCRAAALKLVGSSLAASYSYGFARGVFHLS